MQRLGLSASDFRTYLKTLETGYEVRIIVRVLTRSGDLVNELSPRVLDGQVTVDRSQTPSRTLSMVLVDPSHSIGFEVDGLGDLPLHMRRMIQVGYSVRVPDLSRWVTAWIFTGPLTDLKRQGAEVTLAARGKEALSMGTAWVPRTYRKGRQKTDAIKGILRSTGETRLSIPDLPAKLPKTEHLKRLDKPWEKARSIASSMDRQLFYTGAGVLTMRSHPGKAVVTVYKGVLTEPTIGRPEGDFRNIWDVLGRKPRGEKHRVRATVTLPKAHPLSPQSLGRNGQPYFQGEQVTNDHIRNHKEALTKAKRLRDLQAKTTTEFSCDMLPLPVLDEGDLVRIRTKDEVWVVRAQQFSIPLNLESAAPMTFGAIRRTTRARRRG